jgi:hypothetical protein
MKLIPEKTPLTISQEKIKEPELKIELIQYACIIDNLTDLKQSNTHIVQLTIQSFIELKQPFYKEFEELLNKYTKLK